MPAVAPGWPDRLRLRAPLLPGAEQPGHIDRDPHGEQHGRQDLADVPGGTGDDLPMAVTPDGKTLYYLCPSATKVIPVRTRTLTAGPPINAGPARYATGWRPGG